MLYSLVIVACVKAYGLAPRCDRYVSDFNLSVVDCVHALMRHPGAKCEKQKTYLPKVINT